MDVLCCALGCVILLWLLNLREAKQRAVSVGETTTQLAQTRAIGGNRGAVARQLGEGASTAAALAQARTEREQTAKDVAAVRTRLSALDQELAALRDRAAATEERLAKRTKERADLAKELTTAQKRIAALDVLVRDKETLVNTTTRGAEELAERLIDLNARLRRAQTQADLVPGLREDIRASREKMSASASRVFDLQDEMKGLRRQVDRAKSDADNRFAGIALTGRRVIFLIDMSGSMEQVERKDRLSGKMDGRPTNVGQDHAQPARAGEVSSHFVFHEGELSVGPG